MANSTRRFEGTSVDCRIRGALPCALKSAVRKVLRPAPRNLTCRSSSCHFRLTALSDSSLALEPRKLSLPRGVWWCKECLGILSFLQHPETGKFYRAPERVRSTSRLQDAETNY